MQDESNVAAELASLKTEVKYLKIIIPSACGLVAVLIAIFWGIERNEIGARVTSALAEQGVQDILAATRAARTRAEADSAAVAALRSHLLNISLSVTDIRHRQGPSQDGRYFHFDSKPMDESPAARNWSDHIFLAIQKRTMKIGALIIWTGSAGGSGTAHGRWQEGSKPGDWQIGDEIVILVEGPKG